MEDNALSTTGETAAVKTPGSGRGGHQGEAPTEEKEIRITEQRTQGRKGCKMPRINVAFTPENHQYLHDKARLNGKSMTVTLNEILNRYRADHREEDKAQAEEFANRFR